MSALPVQPKVTLPNEDVKSSPEHIDDAQSINDKEAQQTSVAGGYDGFAQKTDPAEISEFSIDQRGQTDITELVKKLDRYIMISLWSMYWLNYLDRNAIALAKISTIVPDLKLTDTQYQTCVSILFVGEYYSRVMQSTLLTFDRLHYLRCPVKHAHHSYQTRTFPLRYHAALGRHLDLYRVFGQLYRSFAREWSLPRSCDSF